MLIIITPSHSRGRGATTVESFYNSKITVNMKREVEAGVNFLKRLVLAQGKLDNTKAELFAEKLQKLLCNKYDEHWYPEHPSKGQAYRCIRINNGVPCDEVLLRACEESELTPSQLSLPPEVTVWIDPLEVCARSGENSPPFTIACFDDELDSEEERDDSLVDSVHLKTSDYHPTTSYDCGSVAFSDTEEEANNVEEPAESEPPTTAAVDATSIVMVPRIRPRYDNRSNKVKYMRYMPAGGVSCFCPHPHVWPRYKRGRPMLLTPIYAPSAPCQNVFGYYFLPPPPPPPPQLLMPKMPMRVWGAVKG
ncbi:uncharacterized protein ACB058_020270 isoform 2-T2 [Synchiropus picturatus]